MTNGIRQSRASDTPSPYRGLVLRAVVRYAYARNRRFAAPYWSRFSIVDIEEMLSGGGWDFMPMR